MTLAAAFDGDGPAKVVPGTVQVTIPALSGTVLATGSVDRTPPPQLWSISSSSSPSGVSLQWRPFAGATRCNVYGSPVDGG